MYRREKGVWSLSIGRKWMGTVWFWTFSVPDRKCLDSPTCTYCLTDPSLFTGHNEIGHFGSEMPFHKELVSSSIANYSFSLFTVHSLIPAFSLCVCHPSGLPRYIKLLTVHVINVQQSILPQHQAQYSPQGRLLVNATDNSKNTKYSYKVEW